jgi:tRNA dimethylallyltransferase
LLAIVGPTGSGKSSLALQLAASFAGEIVNCDSLQLYRGFDIGTAKTPVSQRQGIPHHLFDVLGPEMGYSSGDYARAARQVLADISGRGRLPVLAGGTGFYLRALLQGLPELPSRDLKLRERLLRREESKPGSLHRLLSRLDPASSEQIHAQDTQKLLRALEIRLLTGGPRTALAPAEPLEGYRILLLGLDPDRAELARRLERRTRQMFAQGLLDEVRGLLAQGLTGDEKPFESLGYRQAMQVIRGECSLAEAIVSTSTGTRQYAKRQRTWFRREKDIQWLVGFGGSAEVQQAACGMVAKWLSLEMAADDGR